MPPPAGRRRPGEPQLEHPPSTGTPEAAETGGPEALAPGARTGPASVLALQRTAGNTAVSYLLRNGTGTVAPPAPGGAAGAQPMPKTSRPELPVLVQNIFWVLHVGGDHEQMLKDLLVNQDRGSELKAAYKKQHGVDLIKDIERGSINDADALRAADYLHWGRLRPLSKVLFAMDITGTHEETVYRTLKDAHDEGAPDSAWTRLVKDDPDTNDLKICKRWSDKTLDQAIDSEFSTDELDKAKAILRRGEMDAIDKIRVATNQVGTDNGLLFEGLREADPKTLRRAYQARYGDSLDTVLFDQYDEEGDQISSGDLSGKDAAEARAFLGGETAPEGDPGRLIRMVEAASDGAGTDEGFIWREVQAVKTKAEDKDPAKAKEAAVAREQLSRLKAKVEDPDDPLDLAGTLGELSDDEYSRLQALLGITVGDAMLDDPLVMKLRSLGGIDWDAFDAVLEADKPTTAAFAAAWEDESSQLRKYLTKYTTVSSGKRGELYKVLGGSLYARLALCEGGIRDDYEDYAYNLIENHATDAQRLELRRALRAVEKGEPPADAEAGKAMAALKRAFNSDEMGRVRKGIQAGDLANPLERSEELEENIERERSWWYGLDDALKDERREMRADIEVAGLDAQMTPAEARRLRQTEKRTAGALEDFIKMRDAATDLASQIVGFAIGLLVTAVTAGAAGPLVIGTLVRAAVVSAIARVLTDKALKGDRFDLLGGDGARSFGLGAVDGVMAVLGGRGASSLLGKIGGAEVAVALEKGTASFALKTVHTAVEGGMGGGVSSVVDATANEQTWKQGVFEGLGNVINAGLAGTGQGAGMSVGTHVAIHGAKAGGGALADRIKGRPPGGAHDPGGGTARGEAGTGGERGTTTAAGTAPENPFAGLSPVQKGFAAREILDQFGAWEHAIEHLRRGTGLAEGMHQETREQIIAALVERRAHVLADVRAKFDAEPVGGASTEPGSDADLNVRGDDAGQKLIAAREYLNEHHPGWERHYRMALLIDAGRVGTVGDHLASLSGPEQARVKQQVDARVLHQSELLATARQVRQLEPGPAQEQLLSRLPAADRARVQELATMDAQTRQQAHDTALLEGDALAKRLRGETDPAERLRLAEESTYKQMLANMLNDEAYITPGAVGEFVSQKPVANASERYQASLDQVLMITHQAQAAGGVLAAMRRYEIFKYISRYCELLEGSGLVLDPADKAKLTWFKNWSEYVYRVEREATGSATAVEGRQVAGGAPKAGTRLDAEPGDVRPGAPDKFLLDNYQDFKAFADRQNGKLRGEAQATTAPGGPGGPAGPNAATPPGLLDLPALTDADHAAAAGTAKTGPDAGPGASAGTTTAAAGTKVAAAGTTPLLGARLHEPIGNPLPNEKAARALIRRLASGDATALHDAGVANVPPNYDPRGREWGAGRRADGTIVLIEGGSGGVDWEVFLAQGGHPLAHSHPLTKGREMKAPGKTMFELIPGTSAGNADSIHVLPSVEDFIFCYENGLEVHDVHTPYVHEGGGKIGNLDPANPKPGVSFQIVGTMRVGDTPFGPVLRSMLVAYDAQGSVLGMQPVYVVAHPQLNGIRLEPPDRMIPAATAAGAGQAPGQPARGRTPAGATSTASGFVPPWREDLAKHAPDAAASDALVHAFTKDLPLLESLVADIGAPAVHALTAELGGPARLEALSRAVGSTGLKNLARDLKGPEIEALVKSHGAEQVKWAAAELRGSEVKELLALPKAELAALSQPPAAGGVTGPAAHRLLKALEAGRLKQLIPAATPANLSTVLELLGPAATRDLADVKIKTSKIPELNEHAANLASQRPGIDAPAPLAANSLMVDANTMIALRKLTAGADWDTGLQPIERNAVNAIRRQMSLAEFDTSSPPPRNASGTRDLAGLVGTTDLRGPNAVLSELDATAPRPAGVALGVARDNPAYAQVIADLSDVSVAKEGRVGKNKGAEDRAAIADALFAARPPGATGDPVFMTADGDVFTRLIPWAVPPVVIPPKFPTTPGEHGLTYAQRFAFQNRGGFTVEIRGRRLNVIPVSEW